MSPLAGWSEAFCYAFLFAVTASFVVTQLARLNGGNGWLSGYAICSTSPFSQEERPASEGETMRGHKVRRNIVFRSWGTNSIFTQCTSAGLLVVMIVD